MLCGQYVTQLVAERPTRQCSLFQLAFPKNGMTADHLHHQDPLLLKPQKFSSMYLGGHIPMDQALSYLRVGRKGVKVCVQESVTILQIVGIVIYVFHKNPFKTTFSHLLRLSVFTSRICCNF